MIFHIDIKSCRKHIQHTTTIIHKLTTKPEINTSRPKAKLTGS